jgi:hypothetical protein
LELRVEPTTVQKKKKVRYALRFLWFLRRIDLFVQLERSRAEGKGKGTGISVKSCIFWKFFTKEISVRTDCFAPLDGAQEDIAQGPPPAVASEAVGVRARPTICKIIQR